MSSSVAENWFSADGLPNFSAINASDILLSSLLLSATAKPSLTTLLKSKMPVTRVYF